MPSSAKDGTQQAVVGTEHRLADTTADNLSAGVYQLQVDLSNLAFGDTVLVLVRVKVKAGGAVAQLYSWSASNPQADPVIATPPIVAVNYLEVALKQTAGTGRSFDWSLNKL